MPSIQVDDDGSVLHYEDTGPPSDDSKDYLTVVFLHGLGINGNIFSRVLPLASSYQARFVVVTSRGYAGSSEFRLEDIEALKSGDKEAQAAVVSGLGQELARFLSRFIQTHGGPKTSVKNGKRVGGIAVVAWSLGCITLSSFLSHAPQYNEQLREHLGQYLRTVVAYDTALSGYGIPPPPDFSLSPFGADTSPDERFKVFMYYASIYQTPVLDLQDVSIPYLLKRTETKQATLQQISREDFDAVVDRHAFDTWVLFNRARPILQEAIVRAYFHPEGIWPEVDVKVFWVDSGSWGMLWGAKWLADRVSSWTQDMRKLDLVQLENANHFMHWDEPERFTRVLMDHLV
ncbi:Alpha/Beta hydrolase protein [Irpex rosettiformis]|uniref:Alpha/Beta hydrolase protein n=1 Tax=Irpex rosettiformis TaxID=378272 RepID=A0ACB8U4W0_9APHY|nr:Alpha/Beta hydrolase protein [Irpex rosettiformis]